MDIATAISAGSALGKVFGGKGGSVGGNLRTQYHEARVAETKRYEATRRGAERAGINPLLAYGMAPMQMATPTNGAQGSTFGSVIADAGLVLADGIAREKDAERATAAERENERLRDALLKETIRPKVAGVYGGNVVTPTARQALGTGPAPAVPSAQGNTNLINGPDGLTQGSETGAELEKDAWNWAREGTLFRNAQEVWNRNYYTPEHRAEASKPWIERSAPVPRAARALIGRDAWDRITTPPTPRARHGMGW